MLTKLKVALITTACLVGGIAGVAAAEGRGGGFEKRAERHAAMLEKYDLNKDGTLDAAEKQAMRDDHAAKAFARLDKNGDGSLSLDEFKAAQHHQARMGRDGWRGKRGAKP